MKMNREGDMNRANNARGYTLALVFSTIAALALVPKLEAQMSFTFLQPPYTQQLFGTAPGGTMGGIGFAPAPSGDVWVVFCAPTVGAPLVRFAWATTISDGHGDNVHPGARKPISQRCWLRPYEP